MRAKKSQSRRRQEIVVTENSWHKYLTWGKLATALVFVPGRFPNYREKAVRVTAWEQSLIQ